MGLIYLTPSPFWADTALMAQSVGWAFEERHGWQPSPSLWSRFNATRGGGVAVEDILVFGQ